MPSLDDIPVHVVSDRPLDEVAKVLPLLYEIRHALAKLAETGESTLIDLLSMPMTDADRERLFAVLGKGEVVAQVDALGPSQVTETACAGVWLVEHRDEDGTRRVLHIEVATTPSILNAQQADIEVAIERLDALIATGSPTAGCGPDT